VSLYVEFLSAKYRIYSELWMGVCVLSEREFAILLCCSNGSMCADCVRTRCFVEFHKAKLVETDVYVKQCMKAALATAIAINDDNTSTRF
jgi:hypothetical protein